MGVSYNEPGTHPGIRANSHVVVFFTWVPLVIYVTPPLLFVGIVGQILKLFRQTSYHAIVSIAKKG